MARATGWRLSLASVAASPSASSGESPVHVSHVRRARGSASVSVPVLSNSTCVAPASASIASGLTTSTPRLASTASARVIAAGTASAKAQGQETTSTASAAGNAREGSTSPRRRPSVPSVRARAPRSVRQPARPQPRGADARPARGPPAPRCPRAWYRHRRDRRAAGHGPSSTTLPAISRSPRRCDTGEDSPVSSDSSTRQRSLSEHAIGRHDAAFGDVDAVADAQLVQADRAPFAVARATLCEGRRRAARAHRSGRRRDDAHASRVAPGEQEEDEHRDRIEVHVAAAAQRLDEARRVDRRDRNGDRHVHAEPARRERAQRRPRRTAARNRTPPASRRGSPSQRKSSRVVVSCGSMAPRYRTAANIMACMAPKPATSRRFSASRDSRRRMSSSAARIERQRADSPARDSASSSCGRRVRRRARPRVHGAPRVDRTLTTPGRAPSARSISQTQAVQRTPSTSSIVSQRPPRSSRTTWRAISGRSQASWPASPQAPPASGQERCAGGSTRRGPAVRSIPPRRGSPGSTPGASSPATRA